QSLRKDLDRDVGTRSRAAAGAAFTQSHALTQPALGHELCEVLEDSLCVQADGAPAARDWEHDDAPLARADPDHDPARCHERASAAASRAAATTGSSAGRCHRALSPTRATARINPARYHR